MKKLIIIIFVIIISLFNSCVQFQGNNDYLFENLHPIDHTEQNNYWPVSVGNYWKYEKYYIEDGKRHLAGSRIIFEISDTIQRTVKIGGKLQKCVLFRMKIRDKKDKRFKGGSQLILKTKEGIILFNNLKNNKITGVTRIIPENENNIVSDLFEEYEFSNGSFAFEGNEVEGLIINKSSVRSNTVDEIFRVSLDLYETYHHKAGVGLVRSKYERKNTSVTSYKINFENVDRIKELKKKHYDYTIMFQLIDYEVK